MGGNVLGVLVIIIILFASGFAIVTIYNEAIAKRERLEASEELCYPFAYITRADPYVICAGPEGEVWVRKLEK